MPLTVQKKSYGSVKVFWLDRDLAIEKIRHSAGGLLNSHPEVERVLLFGSLAQNRATAFSDADILVVVDSSLKRFIDRAADFKDYFGDVGIETDVFVYTEEETNTTPFALRALSQGIVVAERPKPEVS